MGLLASTGFKVGALVLVVSGLIGVMTLNVNDDVGFFNRNKTYSFDLPDASGLLKNSAVRIAGIKHGRLKNMDLTDGQALS